MSKLRQLNLLLLAALASAWSIAVQAEEIYHWVDANGVNHYSQAPPPAANSEVRTLDVDGSQPASYDPDEDLYNIAAQKEATQAVWDKLAEDKKASQNTPDTAENTVIYYPEPDSGNNIFYPPDYRPIPPQPRPPYPRPPKPRPPNGSLLPELPEVAPAVPFKPLRP